MPLRFPNARLFMHILLADRNVSGAQAIALSALEFGLLDEGSAMRLHKGLAPSQPQCKCVDTGRYVLQAYFDKRAREASGSAVDTDKIWTAVEEDAKKYTGNGSKQTICDNCRHDCGKFAPALFDFLLQQIRRYP